MAGVLTSRPEWVSGAKGPMSGLRSSTMMKSTWGHAHSFGRRAPRGPANPDRGGHRGGGGRGETGKEGGGRRCTL